MPTVETVRGPLDTADLGTTLMHEHVITAPLSIRLNWPHLFDARREIAYARKTLDELCDAGVRTIVDLTTFDLGRDVALLRQVAEGTRMQIVVATGVHLQVPGFFRRRTPDPIVELFMRDIEDGIAGTGIKAGAIKVATEQEVTAENRLMLRAAAITHRATGVPILTHSNPFAGTGTAQQDVFESEGVDLRRVVIGHSGDTTDLDYLIAVMERGSVIGMDRFGTAIGASVEQRTETVAALCKRGYADRMVLAHDASTFSLIPRAVLAERLPDWNYLTIPTKVLPALREGGVSEQQIQAMMVDAPRRIFEQQGSY